MAQNENFLTTIPFGKLGIIALESSKSLGTKVDEYLGARRSSRDSQRSAR